MNGAGWHVRPGTPDDRKLLASFACADLAVRWQAEVEQFIQAQLIDWAFDPHADAGDPRNHRSLAVCHKHGLTEEMSRPHPSYRRIVTPHRQQ